MDGTNDITGQGIAARIGELARPVLAELGLELFDLEYQPRGGLLRIVIDRPAAAVSIDDCALASERLSERLDAADPIPHGYRLEVSSPGLDRPLRREDDYRRFRGRLAHLVLAQPVDGRNDVTGRIGGDRQGMVQLQLSDAESLWVPLSAVRTARLVPEIIKGKKKK
ncbi:MAG TPA: ribosome maturation factor RimP [Candidatus Edwardsbacteria bacterium]|nr:ribosome maturation factor RimP [Candidatus Edwardsbacteria bacterium]